MIYWVKKKSDIDSKEITGSMVETNCKQVSQSNYHGGNTFIFAAGAKNVAVRLALMGEGI